MPRELAVGNGRLLVNIDRNMNIRDIYYPHVGLYNHTNGYLNRIGVWAGGQFGWLDDTWTVKLGYRHGSLSTDCYAVNGRLGVGLQFTDTVHPELNILLRRIVIENQWHEDREFRIFFHHDFRICESDIGDTAFYHPQSGSMVHYKREFYFLINGRTAGDLGIQEYAAGVKEFGGAEGTWRDAEDGCLSMHPIEQGSVDSTVAFRTTVPGASTSVLDYWMAVGHSLDEVTRLNDTILAVAPEELHGQSVLAWSSWTDLTKSMTSDASADDISLSDAYERSLLVLQTQVDRCGGIIAANDSDIMQSARAHYSYVWPRDGALVANALDQAGYGETARRFFSFCAALLPQERPFFLQKYSPDGSPGASWHPWITPDGPEVPCQQDSTALVIWAIGKHFERWRDKDFVRSLYIDLVVPAVDYMVAEIKANSGLVKPSYDLWEQSRGVHLWTCATVFGALSSAIKLAMIFDKGMVDKYRIVRTEFKKTVIDRFFDPGLNRFVRSLMPTPGSKDLKPDYKIDASMAALFLFDLLPAGDPKVATTMKAIYDRLWVRTPIGGIARYEDDEYFRISADVASVPGNPWFVTTLWVSQWYTEMARGFRDLEPALDLLKWAASHTSQAGLMAEQLNPYTGQPLSVMPLTWSHGEFITAFIKYRSKIAQFSSSKA